MPIYEYYCNQCQQTFTALRPMSQADAIIGCDQCDSVETHRVLSLFAIKVSGGADRPVASGGGCGCGGACACGGH